MKNIFFGKLNFINGAFAIEIPVICFLFCAYKAWHVPFTHDESISFLHYASLNAWDIITYTNPMNNNHILNTLLMKCCAFLFGSSEFSLRIPNLIGLIIFSIYTYLILKPIGKSIFVASYILIFANPFLLDFFFLARGYGLAIAFMTVSVFHFISYHKLLRPSHLWLSFSFSILSIISNFGLLYFMIALVVIHNLLWLKKNNSFIKHNLPVAVSLIISFILLYQPLKKIIELNLLEVGGNNSFYEDTFGSLIEMSVYGGGALTYDIFKYVSLTFASASIIIGVLLLWKQEKNSITNHLEFFIFSFLLILIVVQIISQHFLLGTPFIVNRFALFLVPLFWFSIAWTINSANTFIKGPYFSIVFYLVATVCFFHTTGISNINSSYIWRYDADNREMLNELTKVTSGKPTQLGVSWVFEPSLNYYRNTKQLTWLNELNRNGPGNNYDFYFVTEADYRMLCAFKNLKVVKYFEHSHNYLLQPA